MEGGHLGKSGETENMKLEIAQYVEYNGKD